MTSAPILIELVFIPILSNVNFIHHLLAYGSMHHHDTQKPNKQPYKPNSTSLDISKEFPLLSILYFTLAPFIFLCNKIQRLGNMAPLLLTVDNKIIYRGPKMFIKLIKLHHWFSQTNYIWMKLLIIMFYFSFWRKIANPSYIPKKDLHWFDTPLRE